MSDELDTPKTKAKTVPPGASDPIMIIFEGISQKLDRLLAAQDKFFLKEQQQDRRMARTEKRQAKVEKKIEALEKQVAELRRTILPPPNGGLDG